MDLNTFDKHIKEALDNLTVNPDNSHWDALAARIDQELNTDRTTKNDHLLDQSIKETIEQGGIVTPENKWSALSEKIDHDLGIDRTSLQDAKLDQDIRNTLGSDLPPINHKWELLEQKLVENQKRRRKLIWVKIAELGILLLFISTIYNYGLLDGDNFEHSTENIHPAKIKNSYTGLNISESILSSDVIQSQIEDKTPNVSNGPDQEDNVKTENSDHFELQILERITQDTRAIIKTQPLENRENSTQPLKSRPRYEADKTMAAVDKLGLSEYEIKSIASLNIPELRLGRRDRELSYLSLNHTSNNQDFPRWWINGYSSLDLNLINSPFDFVYESSAYLIEDLGLSAGTSLSYDTGLAELELGFIYSEKNYVPRKIGEITGSFSAGYRRTSLQEIKYTIASIPINLKLHANRRGKWSYYAAIGASANLILNSHFDIQNEILDAPAAEADGAVANQPKLQNKPFEEGIVEGGNWTDNTFFSTQVGLGVQRSVSKDISAYIQPSYSYHMFDQGVGPNQDFLHALSLQLGVKVAIN